MKIVKLLDILIVNSHAINLTTSRCDFVKRQCRYDYEVLTFALSGNKKVIQSRFRF